MTADHDFRPYLDFAIDAAWQAGRLTLQYFQAAFDVEWKGDDSPVTVADRGAEELLRRLIEEKYPDHAIVGEEFGEDYREDATFRWILDPIDGTRSFIHGVPLYAVLVGLEVEGEMVVGVANFPGLNELVAAATGQGCRWNGRPCRVSQVERLSEALVCFTDAANFAAYNRAEVWERLAGALHTQRGWGDAYGHVLVATGRAEAMLDPIMSVWDCAALLPILQEAGGTFTDWEGNTTAYAGEAISTNGRVLKEILELVR
ncbi:MAG: histidinol-phosphatase [Chloroflexota bacterium]|nr:histidinol-phosphatase [Chloroflexota bacterium]